MPLCAAGSLQGPHEKRVLGKLLSDYNVLERPVANESEPIVISFGISLQQIIDVVSDDPHTKPITPGHLKALT